MAMTGLHGDDGVAGRKGEKQQRDDGAMDKEGGDIKMDEQAGAGEIAKKFVAVSLSRATDRPDEAAPARRPGQQAGAPEPAAAARAAARGAAAAASGDSDEDDDEARRPSTTLRAPGELVDSAASARNRTHGSAVGHVAQGWPDDMQQDVFEHAHGLAQGEQRARRHLNVLSTQVALRELLRGRSLYGAGAANDSLAPFQQGRLSLPESVEGPPHIGDVCGRRGHYFLEREGERMLKPVVEVMADLEREGTRCYCEPALVIHRTVYVTFLKDLMSTLDGVTSAFMQRGLPVHEQAVTSGVSEVLGVEIDGQLMQNRASGKRRLRARRAIAGLLQRGRSLEQFDGRWRAPRRLMKCRLLTAPSAGERPVGAAAVARERALEPSAKAGEEQKPRRRRLLPGAPLPGGWATTAAQAPPAAWETLVGHGQTFRATRAAGRWRLGAAASSSSSSTGTASAGAAPQAGGRDILSAGASLFEQKAAQQQTRKQCRAELDRRQEFANLGDPQLVSDENVEEMLVRYFERDCFLGEQAHRGAKLLAALMHAEPRFGRRGSRRVPRARRALKGWRRLAPGRSRWPEPLCLWAGVVNEMMSRGEPGMALFVLLSVSTYLRQSSLLALGPESFPAPKRPDGHWSRLAHPAERGLPDNIGEFDHPMLLGSSWLQFISPLLLTLSRQAEGKAVWGFAYYDYLKVFTMCAKSLGVNVVPYQTRHSGASIDRESRARTLGEVKQRGGWKADSIVMKYEKHARLRHSELRHNRDLSEHLQARERHLEDILLWGKALEAMLAAEADTGEVLFHDDFDLLEGPGEGGGLRAGGARKAAGKRRRAASGTAAPPRRKKAARRRPPEAEAADTQGCGAGLDRGGGVPIALRPARLPGGSRQAHTAAVLVRIIGEALT
ncbi:unnamed protein product [Prorocentrum cordatum]|uniref:Uncharacterized protein n=1 Tax=Prorocentrum cordatum TaxID=2364126 RepID=A0ABN9WSZ7_9DINO|nr:unnamed protein product [Polarella glacialis]